VALLGGWRTLSNSRAAVAGNAERAEADLWQAPAEAGELERERELARGVRESAQARDRCAAEQAAQLTSARDAHSSRPTRRAHRAAALGREVESLQSERDGLAGRRASLEEMVATHSGVRRGRARAARAAADLAVAGVVADAVETDSEHERAVEAFLGDRLQAVIVPDPSRRCAESAGCRRRTPAAARCCRSPRRPAQATAARSTRSRRASPRCWACCRTSTA
jgi:chromosome segregation protein